MNTRRPNAVHARSRKSQAIARRLVVATVLASLTAPSVAHHSFAMFDHTRTVVLHGTVREFQWTNPHCFLQLLVPGQSASISEWSVEFSSPSDLYRAGWRPATFKPGDKVAITIHPTKDGSRGGSFESAIDANGQALGPTRHRP
ncbi:MAG TPA: DUF6152 family protein [Steroidobacteraceae bacterium]|nr:DUF6152 family protein [Steroidobacteraceae bacterium]